MKPQTRLGTASRKTKGFCGVCVCVGGGGGGGGEGDVESLNQFYSRETSPLFPDAVPNIKTIQTERKEKAKWEPLKNMTTMLASHHENSDQSGQLYSGDHNARIKISVKHIYQKHCDKTKQSAHHENMPI